MIPIKVGFCVAYDWEMLHHALPMVYKHADEILLALDGERKTWSGEKFQFNEDYFNSFIKTLNKDGKIKILEDNFFMPHLTPMQNEIRQRNCMAEFMGKDGWHVQLDCDEYFLEFEAFAQFLKSYTPIQKKSININCSWITLFKQVEGGYLIIDPKKKSDIETIPVATTKPVYEYGRRNGYFNYHTRFQLVHQSWARSEHEVLQKVMNWGHKGDFEIDRFMSFWKSVNRDNYGQVKNFHPILPNQWPALKFVEANSIEDLVVNIKSINLLNFSEFDLELKNSRILAKVKSMLK